MAEKENNGQEPEAPKKKKGLLIVIIVLAQLVVAAALVIFIIYPKYAGNGSEQEEAPAEKTEEAGAQLGPTYTISDLTVNPKGSMGRRFAVFEVVLEMNDAAYIEKVKQIKPVIVDKFLSYLREKTVADFSMSEQMKIIRNDLRKIVNAVLDEDAVKNLYFTRYVLE
jgi:flagellar basal body-associated protein FliL